MRIEVYLNKEMFFDPGLTSEAHKTKTSYIPKSSKLEFRGVIEAKSLEHAYAQLQHLDHKNLASEILSDTRSLSIGDVLKVEGKYHCVRFFGFEELEDLED